MSYSFIKQTVRIVGFSMVVVCSPVIVNAAETEQQFAEPSSIVEAVVAESVLTPTILFKFLLAEIAGARGQVALSVQLYVELAELTRDVRIAKRAVEIALAARHLADAEKIARLWMEIDPDSKDAERMMSIIKSGGNVQLEDIQLRIAEALLRSPTNLPQNLMGLNRILGQVADKAKSQAIIMKVTEPYLNHPEAYFARAQADMLVGDTMGAMVAVDHALELNPAWVPGLVLKTQIMFKTGNHQKAVDLLKEKIAENPENHELLLAYARSLAANKQYTEARAEFNRLLGLSPDDKDLVYAVAVLSFQLKDYEHAEQLFKKILINSHEPDLIRLYLGQIAAERDDFDAASNYYQAITEGPLRVDAQLQNALLLAKQGKLNEARAYLHHQDGDDKVLRRYLNAELQILMDAKQTQEAFELLEAELIKHPDDRDFLYESAILAERVGRFELMESRLRKLIAQDPEHAHAFNALGYSMAERKERLDEAEQLISKALELAPNDPFILDSMGWVYFQKGEFENALKFLEKAYRMRTDPEIAAHFAEVLWWLERKDEAEQILDKALAAYPDNELLLKTSRRLRKP